jgi:SAM-dependent methyltransferase
MRRYAAEGRGDGVARGVRELRALCSEVIRRSSVEEGRGCPVCGWRGPRFAAEYVYDHYVEESRCWVCGSAERCRTFKLYLDARREQLFRNAGARVLEVGPVTYSRRLFPDDVKYVSFDRYGSLASVKGDLSCTPFADSSFDFWLCSHVLDVVPDDRAAMRELHRLLAPDGVGLLDNATWWAERTIEFAQGRAGEYGRLRRYGGDIVERLREAGFTVERVDPGAIFPKPLCATHGLRASPFLLCRRAP